MTKQNIKLVSWNVNGIRSILSKSKDGTKHKGVFEHNALATLITTQQPDIVALQEIRCSIDFDIGMHLKLSEQGYNVIGQNCAKTKKGYSGTIVFSRLPYEDVINDFPHIPLDTDINKEGRVITVIYNKFVFINTYVPNSKPDLSRLDFRVSEWEKNMRIHINSMKEQYNRPVIITGDFNVAPADIDVHNPKTVKGQHGFTEEEKKAFAQLLKECDLVNGLRYLYPNKVVFTWWSNFAKSRERNKGWTIDHFLLSSSFVKKIMDVTVLDDYKGSDHAPVILQIV